MTLLIKAELDSSPPHYISRLGLHQRTLLERGSTIVGAPACSEHFLVELTQVVWTVLQVWGIRQVVKLPLSLPVFRYIIFPSSEHTLPNKHLLVPQPFSPPTSFFQNGLQPRLLQASEGAELALAVCAFMASALHALIPLGDYLTKKPRTQSEVVPTPATSEGAAAAAAAAPDLSRATNSGPGGGPVAGLLHLLERPVSWSVSLMEALPSKLLSTPGGASVLAMATLEAHALMLSRTSTFPLGGSKRGARESAAGEGDGVTHDSVECDSPRSGQSALRSTDASYGDAKSLDPSLGIYGDLPDLRPDPSLSDRLAAVIGATVASGCSQLLDPTLGPQVRCQVMLPKLCSSPGMLSRCVVLVYPKQQQPVTLVCFTANPTQPLGININLYLKWTTNIASFPELAL